MIRAFYTGTNGTISNQQHLDVMSNNMANIQTEGYKRSKGSFSDLLYTNIRAPQGQPSNLKVGSGVRFDKIDTIFNEAPLMQTGLETDFAIQGDGFFAISQEEKTYFTRGGSFEVVDVEGENYLMYQGGYVLDADEEPILIEDGKKDEANPGVFYFENNNSLQRAGNNLFEPIEEDTEYLLSENATAVRGYLEGSGVELGTEVVKLIQIQRAFQINSTVIKTADEIEQIINTLKS